MTTYTYTLVLSDSEEFMLTAALEMIIERCEKEIAGQPKAPYCSWLNSAKAVRSRLRSDVLQASGNNFFQAELPYQS